jgi:hypothetical protein
MKVEYETLPVGITFSESANAGFTPDPSKERPSAKLISFDFIFLKFF